MAIGVVIDLDGVTAEQHDALIAELGLTRQTLSMVPGLIVHAAEPTPTGWRVIDVWESEADMEHFQRERVFPAWERIGGRPRRHVEVTPLATGSVRCDGDNERAQRVL